MNKHTLLSAFILTILLPNILFALLAGGEKQEQVTQIYTQQDMHQILLLEDSGQTVKVSLDEYVLCVLLGEVPADFSFEALKAQAVATRTYTIRRYLDFDKHPNAHLCTNAKCCQAYIPASAYLEQGHSKADLKRIESAVSVTSGQILTYSGEIIEATYFSCSGGRTENAADVWGKDVAYLVSVESPGEEDSRNFEKSTYLSYADFAERLELGDAAFLWENSILVSRTAGGGIKQADICGKTFTGPELRSLLELPSTVIDFRFSNEGVQMITKGNGHRVGMSQYGAEAMAKSGCSYQQILDHYYSGTEMITLSQEQMKGVFDKEGNL